MTKFKTTNIEELRKFGLIFGAMIIIFFGVLIPYIFSLRFSYVPFLIAAIFILWAIVYPASLHFFYISWMKFGFFINRVTTPLILGSVFYLVITPIGLILKLSGKNPLLLKYNSACNSYRKISELKSKDSFNKPY